MTKAFVLSFLGCAVVGCSTSGGAGIAAATDPTEVRKPNAPTVPVPGRPVPMPVKLVGDRFYVEPMTEDGQSVVLFTATGGGTVLSRSAAARLGISVSPIELEHQEQDADGEGAPRTIEVALLPSFVWDAWIPKPTELDGRIPIVEDAAVGSFDPPCDGLLGQNWFKDRVWTFDYADKQLLFRADGDLPKHEAVHRAFLGFPKSPDGRRATNFPRVEVQVEGEKIDLVLDTGATVKLSSAALATVDEGTQKGPASRGASFITTTTFEKWRQAHPDWRVVENADSSADNEAMIEIPWVEIAGHRVGPVWFARRADKIFHTEMSQWTDKRVDGALGGSALKYFRLTIDYPRAMAVFDRIDTPTPGPI